jgi:nucleotide-binding universal stress UspA family protein
MKLLVTLDGSYFSEAVLATVAAIARPLNAEVELLAVGQPQAVHATVAHTPVVELAPVATATGTRMSVPLPNELLEPPAESRAQAIDRVEATLRGYLVHCARESLPGIDVRTRVEFDDDVAGAIIARARQEHPDLIAMTTHGRSGLSHLLAGSVCERVIRSGVAPVIVIRPWSA